MILYASVKPGGTGSDTEAGVRRSNSLFATLLTTQVDGGPRLRRALARRAWPCDPCPRDPGQGTSLLTRVAPPHRGRDIPGCDDPVTGLRRDPLGSTAVHAGPSPSSYTTHLRQAPLDGAQVWGGSRAPAGFRVGAGHGALIETSLTRGGVAAQAHWGPNGSH